MSLPIPSSRSQPATLLSVAGMVIPLLGLIRAQGAAGMLADLGLLQVVWGLSPFLLFPIAARRARRPWVGRMILVLVVVALLFSVVGYLILLPRRTGSGAALLTVFIPVWQWPMALLSAVLSVFVPSEEQERQMSGETPSSMHGSGDARNP
ncbi:MAG: hypothetical protein J0L84_18520 [Verrucomicrobia bacterium]|nr:hypothetical protein [Verrucomicrobiota bacterium]